MTDQPPTAKVINPAMPDLKAALTDDEAEKLRNFAERYGATVIEPSSIADMVRVLDAYLHHSFGYAVEYAGSSEEGLLRFICGACLRFAASPGPALRGEGGSSSASLPATPNVAPEGKWVLVPREPTQHMLHRLNDAVEAGGKGWWDRAYAALIEAAPKWPLEGQGATPEDASGMPKDFLPPDVKAAVERLLDAPQRKTASGQRVVFADRDDLRTLLESHTALTEANGILNAMSEQRAAIDREREAEIASLTEANGRLVSDAAALVEQATLVQSGLQGHLNPNFADTLKAMRRALLAQTIVEGKT